VALNGLNNRVLCTDACCKMQQASVHKVLKTNALGAMQKESDPKIHICRPLSLGFVNFDCVYG
jgi:hypothetical protein